MKSRYHTLFALLFPIVAGAAQPVDDFDAFITGSMKDFDSFITEANREYLDFMRNPWKKYHGQEPLRKRVSPEPKEAPVFNPLPSDSVEPPRQLTIREILDLTTAEGRQGKSVEAPTVFDVPPDTVEAVSNDRPQTVKRPAKVIIRDTVRTNRPAAVSPAKENPDRPVANENVRQQKNPLYTGGDGRRRINFFGVDYYVSDGLADAIKLTSTDEEAIVSAFESLYTADYKPLLSDLRSLRSDALQNDWALYLIVKQISESFVGHDESVVMRQFLLNALGLRARVARIAETGHLSLMIAPSVPLYGCLFITEGNTKFYDVDASRPYSFFMCPKEAPDAKRKIDMSMTRMPHLGAERKPAARSSSRYGTSAEVYVPVQLMKFYNAIPQCDYSVYATAKVDEDLSERLLSSLSRAIAGKTEKDAANILLDFCQNGFEYATDPEQFGYEKPFFAEELFYYPKCDCEDRSVLYRYLVKSLMKRDVVLLDYPNHIATAVNFEGDYPGDHIIVGGRKYLVCDPTFIGASIGMAMPQFKNVSANVLKY